MKITFVTKVSEIIKAAKESNIDLETGECTVSLEVESLETSEESLRLTPDDYYKFSEKIKEYGVNLKDIREIIRLSYSWWQTRRLNPGCTEDSIFRFYKYRGTEANDKVYSEELLRNTINAISRVTNIESDLYSRLKRLVPRGYPVFEDYYKAIYGPEE